MKSVGNLRFIPVIVVILILLPYQNCGKGFEPAANRENASKEEIGGGPLPDEPVVPIPGQPADPPLKQVWNVLQGPLPPGTFPLKGDGVTDDRSALQAIIDGANEKDVIFFPFAKYLVSDRIFIRKPIELLGDGWSGGLPGREARSQGVFVGAEIHLDNEIASLFSIASDDVKINGLKLTGPGVFGPYGDHKFNNAIMGSKNRNTSIVNSWFENWSASAISLFNSTDVAIKNNHITRCHYAGVYIGVSKNRQSLRLHIIGNYIYHLSEPESGPTYVNSYGIVTTGKNPVSDVVIRDNYVERVRIWCGICLHGSGRHLVLNNRVADARHVVFKTFSGDDLYPFPGNDNRWIDNELSGSGQYQFWNAGPRSDSVLAEYEFRNHWIGNRWLDSGSAVSRGQQDLRMHHNDFVGNINVKNGHINFHYSNNNPDNYSVRDGVTLRDDFSTPIPPTALKVLWSIQGNVLTWEYEQNTGHDSFEIQNSLDGVIWDTLGWRPANDGLYSFRSSNPDIIPFDPLRFVDRSPATKSYYRVRSWNGNAASDWSNVVNNM